MHVCAHMYVYVYMFFLALSTEWAKKQKFHSSKGDTYCTDLGF